MIKVREDSSQFDQIIDQVKQSAYCCKNIQREQIAMAGTFLNKDQGLRALIKYHSRLRIGDKELLMKNLMPFDVTTSIVACDDGDLELIKHLFDYGCEFHDTCATAAMVNSHLHVLNFLKDVVKLKFEDPWIRIRCEENNNPITLRWLNTYFPRVVQKTGA